MANSKQTYSQFYKAWQAQGVKVCGPWPSENLFKAAEALGLKPGNYHTLACAMMMRPQGASRPQIVNVLGGPHFNRVRGLETQGKLKRDKHAGKNEYGHTVYKYELKGKASAPKATRKRKPKATPKVQAPATPQADNS